MKITPLLAAVPLLLAAMPLWAEPPKPPLIRDSALKVELFDTFPSVETPTTVAASPDGAVFIGNDPRDGRLSTKTPVCTISRYTGVDAKGKTQFADGLYSPAGMLWHDGWLYVIHDPLLTRFKDTNGDGIADVREDLVTSLGQAPSDGLNDHVVSGFTMGMDGFFYISVGDKGVYHAKGKDGSEATLQGGGIVRCRPDGTQLEVYSGGTRNHLEVDLDALDHAFTLDNTDDGNGWWTRLTHHIESGYYGYPFYYREDATNGLLKPGPQKAQPNPGALPVNERFLPAMTDFGGGSPTGGLCYMSDGLPEQYRGKLLFSEWGKARLSVIEVAPDGASYKFVKNEPLLDEDKGGSFRPMEMYVAADGSLLVTDWGYGGWKSPKEAGSVWRVSWAEAKPAPRLRDEAKASIPELIAALDHPDRDQRLRAEWALVRRGASALPPLIDTLNRTDGSDIQRAHALWAIDLMGDQSAELRSQATGLIRQQLAAKSGALRAQAVRALAIRHSVADGTEIAKLLKDENAEVRLQAAIALGRLNATGAVDELLSTLADSDRWVRFASRTALARIAPKFTFKAVDQDIELQRFLALTSSYTETGVQSLMEAAALPSAKARARAVEALGLIACMPKEWDGHWWGTQPVKNPPPPNTVIWSGTAKAIGAITAALADADSSVRLAAAAALARSATPEALPALRQRLTQEQEMPVRRQIIETLGVQKDPAALDVFSTIALDEKADVEFRNTAIGAVANIGGDAAKATLAKLAAADLSPAATLRVVQAVGELRVIEAAPAIMRQAAISADSNTRYAAIKTLASLGAKANALDTLLAALGDKEGRVVAAALEAIASLHDPKALPALLHYAEGKGHAQQRELIMAVASISDPQTIPILLDGLRSGDGSARHAAISSLKKMREQTWPLIEERLDTDRIPKEFQGEIRIAFDSGVIAKWKVLGPFENVWGAVHPPEAEALAHSGVPDLTKQYVNAEGNTVGWRETAGDAQTGEVKLHDVFKTHGMVCAYAYCEIEAAAASEGKLLTGSDDQLGIWLNGAKVFDHGDTRGFQPDTDTVPIHLQPGTNRLFVKIGNQGGDWVFAARLPGLDGNKFAPSTEPALDARQRTYALAAKPDGSFLHAGDAASGEKLFSDPTAALGGICATCHTVRGKGGPVGPDLTAVAVNYKRPDLITSIHEPSKTIALGFEQFVVETKGGDTFVGAIRQETADSLTVLGADAQPHTIKKADVKSRTAVPVSLMPPGLTLGLKPEQFADLLAYLETLRGQ